MAYKLHLPFSLWPRLLLFLPRSLHFSYIGLHLSLKQARTAPASGPLDLLLSLPPVGVVVASVVAVAVLDCVQAKPRAQDLSKWKSGSFPHLLQVLAGMSPALLKWQMPPSLSYALFKVLTFKSSAQIAFWKTVPYLELLFIHSNTYSFIHSLLFIHSFIQILIKYLPSAGYCPKHYRHNSEQNRQISIPSWSCILAGGDDKQVSTIYSIIAWYFLCYLLRKPDVGQEDRRGLTWVQV